MPPVKPIQRVQAKYERNFAAAGPEYEAGTASPRIAWDVAAGADAVEAIWAAEVQAAAGRKARQGGIRRVGNQKWAEGVKEFGIPRLSQAAPTAARRFGVGFTPVRQAIESTTLPAKGGKGSPAQAARMTGMRDALIQFGRARRGGR